MRTALFIDFDDSFTFNVVQELTHLGLKVEVQSWTDFTSLTDHDLLVLGPGPGNPDDYQILFPLIQEWLDTGRKIFAVCLGHQILWRLWGGEVSRSLYPLHGQKVELSLNDDWQKWLGLSEHVKVQRYNSLAVKDGQERRELVNFILNGEVLMSRSSQIISYQFHPESMGTKCRRAFFRPILRDLL